jgi:hypothetical protein
MNLAHEFLERLSRYVQSEGRDGEAYGWMTERSIRMQRELGAAGVFAAYRPPFANFQYTNYPILLNMLPDLRNALDDEILGRGQVARQYATTIGDVLVRHVGTLREADADLVRAIRNPIIWFREGIRAIVTVPIQLIGWLGALSEGTVAHLAGSRPISLISAIVAIASFVSAIMGIVLGWNEFSKLVTTLWRRIF